MSYGQYLIDANIHHLEQGRHLLSQISDAQYTQNHHEYFQSGVGKHIRHILDHYRSFLEGLHSRIDYDARTRDARLENNRSYALEQIERIIAELSALKASETILERQLPVNSNEGQHSDRESPWANSTIKRELQFLLSHTVHHYALMALVLRILGFRPDEHFGVAPSTLKHREQLQKENNPQS